MIAGIPPGDILDLVLGKGNDVVQFLLPTNLINQWFVTARLTRVCVEPAGLVFRPNFHPSMIGPVTDVSNVESKGSANQTKAIGPLSAPSTPSFQKFLRFVVVSRKSKGFSGFRTDITLDPIGSVRLFLFGWNQIPCSSSLGNTI